jgi:serine/threonine-protein kinase
VASQVQQPYPELSRKSGALGHTNLIADQDMITRRVPLFVRYQNRDFFSLALQVAMKYFGAGIKNIRPTSSGLQLKHIHIPTIGHHQMLVDFNVRDLNIEKFSAVDVLEGKIPEKSFRHKIVLLGITAEEFTPTYKTPGQGQASGIEIVASAVENIINRKHISRPAWSPALEILVLIYFGFFLLFVIPKIQPRIGMLIFALFLATWIGVAFGLFISQGYWLRMVTPTLFSVIGLALVERRRISDKKKDESVELNKSLGLSLQGQGMLDMALERFMKCPIEDKSVQALLYHLGLDFERKRMFNKALAVYNHILKAGAFKDIKSRINNLKKIENTLVLSAGQKKRETALFLADSTTKPTLGRYEIIKELGHGAMGTVYLGKDPSINREVAVKTLSYADVDNFSGKPKPPANSHTPISLRFMMSAKTMTWPTSPWNCLKVKTLRNSAAKITCCRRIVCSLWGLLWRRRLITLTSRVLSIVTSNRPTLFCWKMIRSRLPILALPAS